MTQAFRRSAPALAAALAIAAACSGSSKGISPPLDELLEGGAPVRLGGSFAQLDPYLSADVSDEGSSLPWVELDEGDFHYSYRPAGGLQLGPIQPFASLGHVCVRGANQDTAWAPDLAARVRARLGGAWVPLPERNGVSGWRRNDGVTVHEVAGQVCVGAGRDE